ncbi:hypothetical protein CCH79_00019535, partial [Gambusia affinis]
AFQRTVDQFGRLDIVINNAGINNEKNWEKTIQVNLTSVIKGTYLALEHMSKEYGKQGGTIINVSSMAAFLHSPHQPVYTATKHGVIGFTRAMADAAAQDDYGVRINVLCPAFVDTPLLHTVEEEDNMGKFVKFKDNFKQSMNKFGAFDWVEVRTLSRALHHVFMDFDPNCSHTDGSLEPNGQAQLPKNSPHHDSPSTKLYCRPNAVRVPLPWQPGSVH